MRRDAAREVGLLSRYLECAPYVTRDGTLVRELMRPERHAVARQSLAEAELAPGQASLLHRHLATEELYHVTAGEGELTLGDAAACWTLRGCGRRGLRHPGGLMGRQRRPGPSPGGE